MPTMQISSLAWKTDTYNLTLPDPEHFRATCWAYTLGCWSSVLHCYGFSVLHFPFGTAFHTVCLHFVHLLFDTR